MSVDSSPKRSSHTLFWVGGIVLALAPYLILLVNPDWRASWILPPGRFADNIVIAARHILIGATLGGWLWHLCQRSNPFKLFSKWWKEPAPLNWIWFAFSFVIYSTHNVLLLFNLPFGTGELFSACVGRILTALIVLSLLWFITHIASLAAPRKWRLLPWAIPALFPGFLAADALSILFWKNSTRFIVNRIDEDGSINLARQLSAGGFDHSQWTVLALLALFMGVLCLLCYGSGKLSKIITPRLNPHPQAVLIILFFTWLGLSAEKASGFAWKSRKALQMEHNSYNVHLTPIKPEPGVASFSAAWKPEVRPVMAAPTEKRPDIFLIMLESTRADAIDPAHTPFLARFRDEESQPLGRTWAASNATHLSWYSTFHGQIPNYWGDAIDLFRKKQPLAVSPWIQLLEEADYRTEIRAVCDLSYNGMRVTNFGDPIAVDLLEEAAPGSDFSKLSQPERERAIMERAKESLRSAPIGGNFHFLAIDAPHFEYEWPADFPVPYTEYDPSPLFHAYPDENDIQRVKNRYFNSLAWADHLIEDFVNELKQQGRYENSLIIITGDHGEEFHENGSWFHCSSLETQQTEVPIMIKWPQGTKQAPAQKSASHLDLLPSLYDLLGHAPSTYAHLPGRSLLHPSEEERTQVCLTSFCGIMGLAMAWHRDDYQATFRWENPWATQLPDMIHLDDIVGPNGSLDLEDPAEWDAALREHFPDVYERFFIKFETTN